MLQRREQAGAYIGSSILGGSWVVISGVISRATLIITHIRGLITLPIATHEAPSIKSPFKASASAPGEPQRTAEQCLLKA